MLKQFDSFGETYSRFRWQIPERFNIAAAIAVQARGKNRDRPALIYCPEVGPAGSLTFGQLEVRAHRLAAGLARRGVGRGDRVALLLPQCFETAIAHLAIYKIGAIAVPLAMLFGAQALQYRLKDAGAKYVITNGEGIAKLGEIDTELPDLCGVICTQGKTGDAIAFDEMLAEPVVDFSPVDSFADDPAMIIFTSGTTGLPKGALHAHRVLLGHIPGLQIHHEFCPQEGDILWTPADWAWAGGLLNVLLPGLLLGIPVVFGPFARFDPERALVLCEKMRVRNAFLPPTALRMLKSVDDIPGRFDLNMRTIGSGGEQLGADTYQWARSAFGVAVNEFYGQTEANLVLSSCAALGVSRPGAIGKPVPGHRVVIVDEAGRELPPGESGEIAVARPDPVMFVNYWQNPQATAEKFVGDWMLTGDQGVMDTDGYVLFGGRNDDIITSAGYRIGPGEIEDCLSGHEAVALAAVVGKPDPVRTQIVKAFVKLKPDAKPTDRLAHEIGQFVRARLSAHEYPREIEFVDDIPLTTSGKVIRRSFRERSDGFD